MNTGVEAIGHTLATAAEQGLTVDELGALVSEHVGSLVAHDGYLLVGMDPVFGTGAFLTRRHGYGVTTSRRMEALEVGNPCRFQRLAAAACPVGVLGTAAPDSAVTARHDVPDYRRLMAAEGVGGEMRVALTSHSTAWGALVLLRAGGGTGFNRTDIGHARRLAPALTAGVRRFAASGPPRPSDDDLPPAVLVIGPDGTVVRATASAHRWIERFPTPDTGDGLAPPLWHLQLRARHGRPAHARLPTSRGWIALEAQPLHGGPEGEVVVTIQPARAATLLDAVAAWHGLTPKEKAVAQQAVRGLPVKRIARHLDLSAHTVNDHLKAIYRKIAVNSRDELAAMLV
ncbi:helix-turn-helix transcriptional regulator [Saccharothrix australiensis]|uniref:helix-turn-helix transcriptional regulator n=1 Tax=Saccharothrix australiensis TaxID=2072 RepID=UPI0011C48BFF|nr:helix-turn-helix transcriptional regulator [Saccharothrix australiensis]